MRFHVPIGLRAAALLALAGIACLLTALHLLDGGGGEGLGATARLALGLGLAGALVVFLLGLAALLTARRLAFGRRAGTAPPPALDLIRIEALHDELAAISDGLRSGGPDAAPPTEIHGRVLEVPPSWRPDGRYTTGPGSANDPGLEDLKRTRDQLLEAAERVEAIVAGIQAAAAAAEAPPPPAHPETPRRPWWKLR